MVEALTGIVIGFVLFFGSVVLWTVIVNRASRTDSSPKSPGDEVRIGDQRFVIHTMSKHGPETEVLLLDRASYLRRYDR